MCDGKFLPHFDDYFGWWWRRRRLSYNDVNLFMNSVRICVTRIEIKMIHSKQMYAYTYTPFKHSQAVDFYFVWLAVCKSEVHEIML